MGRSTGSAGTAPGPRRAAGRGLGASGPAAQDPVASCRCAVTDRYRRHERDRPAIRGHDGDADGGAADEERVEEHVVKGERPAAEGVAYLLLQDRRRTDGNPLAGQTQEEAEGHE